MPKPKKPAKKTKPDDAAIKAEIATLKKMKPRVRHHTMFGDDNHAAIDAQIAVLEGAMSEDEIFDTYPGEEGDEPQSLQDEAMEARRWLDGEKEAVAPSENWKELAK